jgi:hypothetical protein
MKTLNQEGILKEDYNELKDGIISQQALQAM